MQSATMLAALLRLSSLSPLLPFGFTIARDGAFVSGHNLTVFTKPTSEYYDMLVSTYFTRELQNNNLSGPLPDYIANLTYLQYLNLADNNFNGSIPATWCQLSSLKNLYLSSNALTGSIPTQLFSVPMFNFSDTHLQCGSSLEQPCVSKSEHPDSTNKSKLAKAIRFASCGAFALLFLGAVFTY